MTPLIRTKPYVRRLVWGGKRLADDLGVARLEAVRAVNDGVVEYLPVAESLEVSGLEVMPSRVLSNRHGHGDEASDGRNDATLLEVFRREPTLWSSGAPVAADGGSMFPLLVKRLDVARPLSIQVHPDDGAAKRLAGATNGKDEAWVVLDAVSKAEILLGLREDKTLADVEAAAGTERMLDLMRRVPVKAGDVIHVPAGCLHGILPGVLLFEAQQPSDLTYRVYDYGRRRADGSASLHLREALACCRPDLRPNALDPIRLTEDDAATTWSLCRTSQFRIERHDVRARTTERQDVLRVFHVTTGRMTFRFDDVEVSAAAGETVVAGQAAAPLTVDIADGSASCLVVIPAID